MVSDVIAIFTVAQPDVAGTVVEAETVAFSIHRHLSAGCKRP